MLMLLCNDWMCKKQLFANRMNDFIFMSVQYFISSPLNSIYLLYYLLYCSHNSKMQGLTRATPKYLQKILDRKTLVSIVV